MEMSFGARLRQHREQQQVSLATIATETKIKLSLLEGLERDDISHWPGGIFRRSYVRAYAEAIGLDADTVTREFLALYAEPADDAAAVAALANALPKRRPPTRLTYLINSAISALPSLRTHSAPNAAAAAAEDRASDEITSPPSIVAADFALSAPTSAPVPNIDAPLQEARLDEVEQPLLDLELEPLVSSAAPQGRTGIPYEELTSPTFRDDSAPLFAPVRAASAHVDTSTTESAGYDIAAVASLCTRLGRAGEAREVLPVLEEATTILDAIGLILWTWDPRARTLRPALSHGYSEELLSQVPPVPPDSDNAIGSAFRSAETRIVNGDELATGALAVPLITPTGCTGVLAAEFRDSGEQHEWVRGVVTILAAQLSMLVGQPAGLRAATA